MMATKLDNARQIERGRKDRKRQNAGINRKRSADEKNKFLLFLLLHTFTWCCGPCNPLALKSACLARNQCQANLPSLDAFLRTCRAAERCMASRAKQQVEMGGRANNGGLENSYTEGKYQVRTKTMLEPTTR